MVSELRLLAWVRFLHVECGEEILRLKQQCKERLGRNMLLLNQGTMVDQSDCIMGYMEKGNGGLGGKHGTKPNANKS